MPITVFFVVVFYWFYFLIFFQNDVYVWASSWNCDRMSKCNQLSRPGLTFFDPLMIQTLFDLSVHLKFATSRFRSNWPNVTCSSTEWKHYSPGSASVVASTWITVNHRKDSRITEFTLPKWARTVRRVIVVCRSATRFFSATVTISRWSRTKRPLIIFASMRSLTCWSREKASLNSESCTCVLTLFSPDGNSFVRSKCK